MSRKHIDTKLARRVQDEVGCKYQTALNVVRGLLEKDDELQPWEIFKEEVVMRAVEELRRNRR